MSLGAWFINPGLALGKNSQSVISSHAGWLETFSLGPLVPFGSVRNDESGVDTLSVCVAFIAEDCQNFTSMDEGDTD